MNNVALGRIWKWHNSLIVLYKILWSSCPFQLSERSRVFCEEINRRRYLSCQYLTIEVVSFPEVEQTSDILGVEELWFDPITYAAMRLLKRNKLVVSNLKVEFNYSIISAIQSLSIGALWCVRAHDIQNET